MEQFADLEVGDTGLTDVLLPSRIIAASTISNHIQECHSWLVVWNMTFIFPSIQNNHPN